MFQLKDHQLLISYLLEKINSIEKHEKFFHQTDFKYTQVIE